MRSARSGGAASAVSSAARAREEPGSSQTKSVCVIHMTRVSAQLSTGPVRVRSVCGQDVCSLEQGWLRESTPRGGTRELHTLRDGDHLQPRETSGQVAFWESFGFRISGPQGGKAHYVLHAQHPPPLRGSRRRERRSVWRVARGLDGGPRTQKGQ